MRVPNAERAAPDPFALAGALLDGKYRVDRVVAEGGFGVVYAGHHTVLDVPIAIKVLKPTSGDPLEQGQRFSREAQTIAKLKHSCIVQVLDAGLWRPSTHGATVGMSADDPSPMRSSEPIAWMVLEWLTGQTLKANLAERRGLAGRTPAEAMSVMRPVLEAVEYAHSKHVVHRDLKPSNIMLSPGDGRTIVRVLDFGVAKVIEEDSIPDTGHTQTGGSTHAFSRRYAAPEQLSGGRTGPWTDLHALGLLLTELLTDRAPYDSSDPTDLYALVFHEDRPSPARCGIDVGPWQAIIERAVSLKPSRRFADVSTFGRALEETLDAATSAFVACQANRARVTNADTLHASATDTTRSEVTESNTFSVFSSVRPEPNRSSSVTWGSRRTMSRLVALAAVASAGSYFVFSGHRSSGAMTGGSDANQAVNASPHEPPPPAPLALSVLEGAPAIPVVRDIAGSVGTPPVSGTVPPKAAQKSRSAREPASPVASSNVPAQGAPARGQLPAYVVE